MLSLPLILSLFSLLFIAGFVSLFSEKQSVVPYSVLLVLVGMFVAFLGHFFKVDFLTAFKLTPELLFFIFLPALIFEAAYNVKIRSFYKSFFSINLLATLGLFVSTGFIGFSLHHLLAFVGFQVPLLLCLLFGAVISATDPVSVLALFKSLGAPKRLSLMFEGESLFNDATAVALFIALLGIIQSPAGVTSEAIFQGMAAFLVMIFAGALFGLGVGKFFSGALRLARHHEMATLTFMLVMAHLTFLASESINEFFIHHGYWFNISPIIATTVASMELGNDGGLVLSPRVKKFAHSFWEQTTFFANSIVFLLVGILLIEQNLFRKELILPMVLAAVLVSLARFIAVYPITSFVSRLGIEAPIPRSWRFLMAWAGIRGALSIIIVLTLPDNLFFPEWSFSVSPKEFIVGLTLGSVVASLVGKTLTVPILLRRLKVLDLNKKESLMLSETKRFLSVLKESKIKRSFEKGYISKEVFVSLVKQLEKQRASCVLAEAETFENVIQHYALGIEKYYLQELYGRGEVGVVIYNRIYQKIDTQEAHLEGENDLKKKYLSEQVLRKIQFFNRKFFTREVLSFSATDQYLYYRALSIMSRKVLKNISEKNFPDFYKKHLDLVVDKYSQFYRENNQKMEKILHDNPEIILILQDLGQTMLDDFEKTTIQDLTKTHFTTNRVAAHLSCFNKK